VEVLAVGKLSPPLREQIALVTAGINECDYCASVHTLVGKGRGLSASELAANLVGSSQDEKVQIALNFAKAVIAKQGHVSNEDVQTIRHGGYNDSEIVEIVAHVGMNIFTNYFIHIAETTIDFPLVKAKQN
jgi:AhpD family alkylhydroperoxidase